MSLFGTGRQTINGKLKDIKSSKDKLRVTGCERLARKLRKVTHEITDLKDNEKQLKAELLEKVSAKRLAAEKAGAFYKTCLVSAGTENGEPQPDVMVSFADAYSEIPLEHEKLMQTAFGKTYDKFFTKQAAVKVSVTRTTDEIREAVGDKAFLALQDMGFTFTDVIKAKGDLMAARARLRAELPRTTNERLDVVQAAVQKAPSVRGL